MAEFCKQCSIKLFGKDFEELAGLCEPGEQVVVICEGCCKMSDPSAVNHLGECVIASHNHKEVQNGGN
jgi:hypothetical protein